MLNVQLVISCSKDIAIPFEHDLHALPTHSHNAIPQRNPTTHRRWPLQRGEKNNARYCIVLVYVHTEFVHKHHAIINDSSSCDSDALVDIT
jgi:hypothetical protein